MRGRAIAEARRRADGKPAGHGLHCILNLKRVLDRAIQGNANLPNQSGEVDNQGGKLRRDPQNYVSTLYLSVVFGQAGAPQKSGPVERADTVPFLVPTTWRVRLG